MPPSSTSLCFCGIILASIHIARSSGILGARRVSRKSAFALGSQTRRINSEPTRLESSLFFEPPPQDENILKWEQMYEEGERSRAMSKKLFGESVDLDPEIATRSEIRVVTFDLDNTLWRTREVITAANKALSAFLEEKGVVTPVRTEVVMGELFKKNKARYCPYLKKVDAVDGEDADKGVNNVGESTIHIHSGSDKPVLLTQLRKDAISDILVRHNDFSKTDATDFVDEAFDVWTNARHAAIPDHFAGSVLHVMEKIRSLRTSTGQAPIVGAITDGNSDPRIVPGLGEYFDFVVNSESVGVSKPDRRVYYAAIAEVASRPAAADLFVNVSPIIGSDGKIDENKAEDAVGPWWCHIGDDFIKDCVAAKELKMRSVWCRELVLPSGDEATEDTAQEARSLKTKKREVADLVKELSEMKVVEMSIGAEDFLADSIQREFADAILDRFSELGSTLAKWHEDGLGAAASNEGIVVTSKSTNIKDMEETADMLEVVEPNEPSSSERTEEVVAVPAPSEAPQQLEAAEKEAKEPATDTKFCVYCGTKLPMVAKFCSSCGEKQPDLK